jgi:hypothetical protein
MDRVRVVRTKPGGASSRLGVSLVLCAVWAALAVGSHVRAYPGGDAARPGEQVVRNALDAQQHPVIPQNVDPTSRSPSDRELMEMAVFIVVGVTGMVLSWLTRLYVRNSATTDPARLALSDPWMRERLGQLQSPRDGTPADQSPAGESEPPGGEISGPRQ